MMLGVDAAAGRLKELVPGVATALLVAAAASFVADTYGGPVMLLALLMGIALNFLSEGGRVGPGIRFTSKDVLKVGVALLGLRIAASDIAVIGANIVIMLVAAMALTIAAGIVLARLLGRSSAFGVLVGGATAICGASAALALSSVLPKSDASERETAFAVVSVTTLSTVAMVVYPVLARLLGFDDHVTGILLGATIHDVAQVVGAGYATSLEAGDTATVVKLFRVAMLVPVVLAVSFAFRGAGGGTQAWRLPVPYFVLAFAALVALNSIGLVPEAVKPPLVELSRWCLVAAVAAIGLTTSIPEMLGIGRSAISLSVATTLILLAGVLVILMAGA